jgi:phosphomannomutase
MKMSGIFKAYDIRGNYPGELNEMMAHKIGACFILLLKAEEIVVGRDMRLSASSLAKAFIQGAVSAGASVTDIGMVSTPMLYYAIIEGKYEGGAMVTASHLPGGMNGFKLCREDAIPLSGDHGLPELERLFKEKRSAQQHSSKEGSCRKIDFMDKYIDKLTTFVHEPKPLKIVVDAGNGMAGPEVPLLFMRFPAWKWVPMYMEPDGSFPHHIANPLLPSATKDLQAAVLKEKADLGAAFDGDADRCGFIDEKGERIPEDLVTGLIAEFLLKKEPKSTILYDLRSSRVVLEVISDRGGKAVRSRVGHAFIKDRMRKENAVFAGELSGHYYYRDMGFTDNGLFTMIQMLNFLSWKEVPLSRLIQPLKKYFSTGEINIQIENRKAVFSALKEKYHDSRKDHLDGLTVEYDSWWFNLRASNTEPLMRLNLEAKDSKLMEEKNREVLEVIRGLDPSFTIQA